MAKSSKKPTTSSKTAKPAASKAAKPTKSVKADKPLKLAGDTAAPAKSAAKPPKTPPKRRTKPGAIPADERAPLTYKPPVSTPTFAIEVARLLRDLKCTEVVLLDVRGHSQLADYLVLASGTSDRQMSSVAGAVETLARDRGEPVKSTASDTRTTWCVVDCIETIVHIFEPTTRAYYDLETMHEGAKRLDWDTAAKATPSADGSPIDESRQASDEARARAKSRTRKTTE